MARSAAQGLRGVTRSSLPQACASARLLGSHTSGHRVPWLLVLADRPAVIVENSTSSSLTDGHGIDHWYGTELGFSTALTTGMGWRCG